MAQESQQAIGELLLAGCVKHEDFAALIKAYSTASDDVPLLLLECQPDHVIVPEERQALLHFARFGPHFDLAPYTSGRIFHEDGELRWEKQPERIQIVYTGKQAYKPTVVGWEELLLDEAQWHERSYILFGKRLEHDELERIGAAAQTGDFAEVRIPRILRYPAVDEQPKTQRVQLVVCEYLNPATGMNIAYRFKRLKSFKQEGKQRSV